MNANAVDRAVSTVVEHANLLELSEYDVFCRAYVYWYGQTANATIVERDFGRYLMFAHELPCYVRAYLRGTGTLAA